MIPVHGDDDCPFCRIIRGEEKSAEIICEGETWVAFFPIEPATAGHTLVAPRQHVADLWASDPRLAADLIEGAIRVGRAINEALEPDGMNLITSAGEAATQTVFHLHLHVVPRWHTDRFGEIWPPKTPMPEAVKQDVADQVRAACSNQPGVSALRSGENDA